MKRRISLVILALTLIASLSLPIRAAAQSADSTRGLAITPPVFELSANPGDTITNSIRVDNVTDAALDVSSLAENFSALGEEGQVGLSEEESAFSLASWITISPANFKIPAKSSKVFDFSIKVPANAEPGGRFGSVVFKTQAKPPKGSGLAVGQEVGSLLMLRVAGDVSEKATIESFKTTQAVFERGPIRFETRVKNNGNVHLKPTGTITITNIFGKKVATVPVNAQNVLPDAIRKLTANWTNAESFGRYTATISLQYGNSQETLTSSTTFMIIPWRLVLAWAIGVGILIFLLYLGRKRFGKALRILFGKE